MLKKEIESRLSEETTVDDDLAQDMKIFLMTRARVAVKRIQNRIQDDFLDKNDSEEIIETARNASSRIAQLFEFRFANKYMGSDIQFEDLLDDLELVIGEFIIDAAIASLPKNMQ